MGMYTHIDVHKSNYTDNRVTMLTPFVTDSSADLMGYENMVHGKLTTRKLSSQTAEKTEEAAARAVPAPEGSVAQYETKLTIGQTEAVVLGSLWKYCPSST
jgi:hypothetical protein